MKYQCLNPVFAVNTYTTPEGKCQLSFRLPFHSTYSSLIEAYGADNIFSLPCGKCESCRRNYAQDWAIRVTLESLYHSYNYFITLTFDDPHYIGRSDTSLKKDFDRFLDRLEGNHHKNKFKYFACFEHGELNGRFHIHCILMSDLDLELYDSNIKNGYVYYHSNVIDKVWTLGLHDIARFDPNCARYIAKYTTKDENGFTNNIRMSNNIGKQYFLDHYKEIIADGFKIYGDFGKKSKHVDIPRAMVYWFKDIGSVEVDSWQDFKKNIAHLFTVSESQSHKVDYLPQSEKIHRDHLKDKVQKKGRS